MKSLRFLSSPGRLFVAATLLVAALLCCTMPAARADSTVTVLDSGVDTASLTFTGSMPRTYMGSPFTLGNAAGTTNIPVNGGSVYLAAAAAANYSDVQFTVFFWGTVNQGAVSAAAPAYSNLLRAVTYDVGPLAPTGVQLFGFDFDLATPLTIPTQTLGVTVAWKSSVGTGALASDSNLTSVIRYGPAMPVGTNFNGYYRNANSEANGNFITGLRGLAGTPAPANQAIAIDLTAVIPTAVSGALINEFRTGGPGGVSDEFIEIYNQGTTPIDLTGWSVTAGAVTVTIPTGKFIKPYGRLLLTGSGYSLANYGATGAAAGDVSYSGDIPLGATLSLLNAAGTTVDTVNSSSLAAPTSLTSNYSFVRRMDGAGGAPQTGGDFNTVDVASTVGPNNTTGVSSNILRLGAPGPQNLASPTVANQFITFTFANQVRVGSGNGGTLALRYVVANPAGSGRTITALRFRATALTAGTTAVASDGTNSNGPADVRLISSSASGAILPLSLETPPAQANGGGLNSSVSLSGLPAGGIAAGTSVTVEFLFNVVQRGQYRFLLNLEPVTTTP